MLYVLLRVKAPAAGAPSCTRYMPTSVQCFKEDQPVLLMQGIGATGPAYAADSGWGGSDSVACGMSQRYCGLKQCRNDEHLSSGRYMSQPGDKVAIGRYMSQRGDKVAIGRYMSQPRHTGACRQGVGLDGMQWGFGEAADLRTACPGEAVDGVNFYRSWPKYREG